ncbi:related to member of RSC complex [Cephalotrichum gorgonifer]|uniref:Related to member of RSC complex n=1 Tax=Cephalotrichum gorgonifer TaxID=2041049 RepID=A0AAE8N4M7_9PEZI|nr:related to member of RSC complex [Cephalotrichum gorgonifer]
MPSNADATEVRETIEAKGVAARAATEDVDMKDAGDEDADGEADAEGEDVDGDGEADAEGEEDEEEEVPERGSKELLQTIHDLSAFLCSYKEDGEEDELAIGFQRIPNRRTLPHYFEVISTPIAFSTIRQKVMRKQYTAFPEFVRDVAQICHNAQVFNRPSAGIFGAAVRLRELFVEELQKLVDQGVITESEAELPDLGDLPSADESPAPEDDEEEEEEDDEEDEEEEDDDDDDEGTRRRGRRSRALRRRDSATEGKKRRGRPPRVLTPMEARIQSVIKGLRKPRDEDGDLMIYPFEKLPDRQANPDYYQVIGTPIALDHIKKKAKRKKYRDVDHVLADIELMFENAKRYNEDGSDLFEAAVELQKFARQLARQEKDRPDEDFRDDEGKLPLSEIQGVQGETWRVGDWVHVRNANDPGKPVVAQIYRTWQDPSGQRWINACWYYRPEQTVHRAEKHFYEHEVVKTGQYRDHRVEEIVDRCFVMFVTRFPKGRPQGLPRDKAVYVCESRYNEEKHTFNKIKTWASCLPDEVRERDYVMDLYPAPLRMRKVPSPIKHLLRDDAKPTDDLPKPTWGNPSAPPIVGAVHNRAREPNESPPPEPSPPPTPAPPVQPRSIPRPPPPHSAPRGVPHVVGPTHHPVPVGGYHMPGPQPGVVQVPHSHSPAPPPHSHYTPGHFQPSTPHAAHPATPSPILRHNQVASPVPPAYIQHQQPPVAIRPMHLAQQQQQHHPQQVTYIHHQAPPQAYAGAHLHPPHMQHQQHMQTPIPQQNYNHHVHHIPTPSRAPMAPTPGNAAPPMHHQQPNAYNAPRTIDVYTLADAANEAIPEGVRKEYHADEQGRVLFFAAPPATHDELSKESAGLAHSARYLEGLDEWKRDREEKRRARDLRRAEEGKRRKVAEMEAAAARDEKTMDRAAEVLAGYFGAHEEATRRIVAGVGLE